MRIRHALLALAILPACQSTPEQAPVAGVVQPPADLLALLADYSERTDQHVTFDQETREWLAGIPVTQVGPASLNTIQVGPTRVATPSSELEFEVIPLENATAGETALVLDRLVRDAEQGGEAEVKVMADPRTNALLILADAKHMANLKTLVAMLDVKIEG